MDKNLHNILKNIPPVNDLLKNADIMALYGKYGYSHVRFLARTAVAGMRAEICANSNAFAGHSRAAFLKELADRIKTACEDRARMRMCAVVNATGTLLHTGLGRAPLSASALQAISDELRSYSALSVDAASNKRARRERFVSQLLCEITGAQSATAVNNNAAAALLCLSVFAKKKEVIVSRGQLVEIGGSFRLPEVLKQSGARLIEVGTTNRTYLKDYANAITEKTAVILKVHTGNYKITGFTEEVETGKLAKLAKKHRLILMDDIGSGALVDTSAFGIGREPMVRDSVRDGANITCFSADKLIGGPQAGIILGKRNLIDELRSNPLFRALRPDKLTLVCLEATLNLFLHPERLSEEHALFRMFALRPETIEKRANLMAEAIRNADSGLSVTLDSDFSDIGGGSLPAEKLPTIIVKVQSASISAEQLARKLRMSRRPVFARIKNNYVILDARTVFDDEIEPIADAFARPQ
ncbi:MAG: L-seryl-tRNA(Sec) selenium transferase [Planctomycetes bacterium]|nr:L-seryl-tRNA(Sec) selenium transferase [Planctomycetota bacterium]